VPEPGRAAGGLRLALATLTVAPVRAVRIDRATAAVAMSLAPAVGLALGFVAAVVGLGLRAAGAPLLLAAVGAVATPVLLTRGLHLDGLADTADGLGSYADRETALAIMRKPDVGPFGVVTLILVLLTQVAAATAVLARAWPSAAAGVVAAVAAGRVAITLGCRRGVPPARPDGLGALVAGTVPTAVCLVSGLVVAAVAIPAVPGHAWQGPVAVALAALAALALFRHAIRRLGGITGDVLGAATEVAVTVTYFFLSM
jgi:adenosylcobinamide-GDP ribazoletransferase